MGKEIWRMLYKLYNFWKNLVLPRFQKLHKLDFPPFPVFLKLSHPPELSWEILN